MKKHLRINVGCGQSPTEGWLNFDNSLSLRICRIPLLSHIFLKARVINDEQFAFIKYAKTHKINYADIIKGLPINDNSVEVLYSSHMLEHLTPREASIFLTEAKRILCSNGIIRLVVPDLFKLPQEYMLTLEADKFITGTLLSQDKPNTFLQKLTNLIIGNRQHHWMYDGTSLCRLLSSNGFVKPKVMMAGETNIESPGKLDLFERAVESVYVEAFNP
jgi:predicted SAM-dependent methyltransferase